MSVLVLAMLTLLSGLHAKIHRLHRWFPLCINRFLKYKDSFFLLPWQYVICMPFCDQEKLQSSAFQEILCGQTKPVSFFFLHQHILCFESTKEFFNQANIQLKRLTEFQKKQKKVSTFKLKEWRTQRGMEGHYILTFHQA